MGRQPAAEQPKTHADRVEKVVALAKSLDLDGVLVAVERRDDGDDGIGVVRLGGLRALEVDKALQVAHAVSAQTTSLRPATEGGGQ